MKIKLGALLLITTSLHASDHYNAEQCAHFRNNATYNLVLNHNSFKKLPVYLNTLEPLIVPIPVASKEMQYGYMVNFIAYYNSTIYRASSDIYCSLYGKYYNDEIRCAEVHEHLTDLIMKFTEYYKFPEGTSDDFIWENRLTIQATGEHSLSESLYEIIL